MQTKVAEFLSQKEAKKVLQGEIDDTLLTGKVERRSELCQIEVILDLFQPGNVIGVVVNNRYKKGTVLGYSKSKTGKWRLVLLMYPCGPIRHIRIDPASYLGDIAACREPERERVYLYQSFCWSKRTQVALIVDKKAI